MDKYEFKLKVDEMKALVSARNYNAAAEIAETINWRKIRNLNALVLAGEVFEQVGRYEESKEILLMAYDKSPIGRNIIYRLAEIAVKTKRFDEAQEYYDEFVDIAPHDNLKFVLKYKMTAAQGLPYQEQIRILEELKEQEYSEEWAYELAYLYHKNMQPEKCVEACDELILWFGDGIYVEKALELKMHYQQLTKPQEEKYRIFRQKRTGVIEVKPNDFLESGEIVHEAVEIPSVQTNTGQYNTANLQEEIAKGMQQISAVKMQKAVIQQQRQPIPNNSQVQQNSYMGSKVQQVPCMEPQVQQEMYIRQSQQESGWQEQPELEQISVMTMEEIQAEWEKTKQEMNDVLCEEEGLKQEATKERSFVKAEDLMQQLLGIIPQLAEKMEQQDLTGENSAKVQNDLEQASRIVAGINQLLQEQIDSLTAEKEPEPEQEPVIHRVSDPTREMPHLPEDLLEGKEIGAVDKVGMNGSSLKKVSAGNDDNPVMSAWKDAPPGISALDLLQRVRMEKAAAKKEQVQAEHAADAVQQKQPVYSAIESLQRLQMQESIENSMPQVQESTVYSVSQVQELTENSMPQVQESTVNRVPQTENETYIQGMLSADRADAVTRQEEMRTADSVMEEKLNSEDSGNTGIEAEYSEENISIADYSTGNTGIEAEYAAENSDMQMEYTAENSDMQMEHVAGNPGMQMEYAAGNPGMQMEYAAENPGMQVGYAENPGMPDINTRSEYPQESGLKYSLENMDMEVQQEYPVKNMEMEVQQEYPLENNRRDAPQEFENEQENLFLAARPRFLTQAQLQAESVMDGNKNTQVTKEFSKEAIAAAHSAGYRENIPQPASQNMEEMKKLTPDQKQIFSYFVPIAGMEAQIYDLLMGVSQHLQYDKHAQSGNIIIEGISGSGKTVLIMDIIKVLQKEIKRPVGKTGKIDANALNQKDLDVLIDKISGGCLIIESAGKISRETAVRLSRCMDNDHTGTLYILEDTAEGIQKALERDSSFAAKFTEKISIPLFSPDELVEFGKAYANDLNYDIDEMGVLALYKRIGAIQKLDHVTTLTEVKEIVDEAIDNAEKGVLKKVFGMLTATRANDDNYIILREKDFEDS